MERAPFDHIMVEAPYTEQAACTSTCTAASCTFESMRKHELKMNQHLIKKCPVAAITVLVCFAKFLEIGKGSALFQGQTTWKCQVGVVVGHAMVAYPCTVPSRC